MSRDVVDDSNVEFWFHSLSKWLDDRGEVLADAFGCFWTDSVTTLLPRHDVPRRRLTAIPRDEDARVR